MRSSRTVIRWDSPRSVKRLRGYSAAIGATVISGTTPEAITGTLSDVREWSATVLT